MQRFLFVLLHCLDAECFYPGSSLVSKEIYLSYPRSAKSIAVNPVNFFQEAIKIRTSAHSAPKFKPSTLSLSCSNNVSPEDYFLEQENYTDEEVEALVAKTERLWAEAYDARKLADDLSDQVEKLAGETENKVPINLSCTLYFGVIRPKDNKCGSRDCETISKKAATDGLCPNRIVP